jgi:hypothetical protein
MKNQNETGAFGPKGGLLQRCAMSRGDQYRVRALEFLGQAETAKNSSTRTKFANLSAAFMRLAIQSERSDGQVIHFEGPAKAEAKNPGS